MQSDYKYILCRYGELSTKGKNRKDFIRQLTKNVKSQLKSFDHLSYHQTFDRLYIYLNGENPNLVAKELEAVFGLSSFSFAAEAERDLDSIASLALKLIKQEKGKTFKVIARRHDKSFEHMSDTINRHVAGLILRNTDFEVDVHNPDIPIYIEVRRDAVHIMLNKISGAMGYPVGIQGKAMMLLSGGIDSPVASYLMMKRGVHLEFVHFASPPFTSDQALEKVLELAQTLTRYQNEIRVHVVPFTKIQQEIHQKTDESYAITLMRRFMLRIADKMGQKLNCLAISNGESLGQVASQTLESMKTITNFQTLPILRPLITYDKIEIIQLSEKIGTYETSILPYEDCCTIFNPKNPVTKPKDWKIDEFEEVFDIEALVDEAIQGVEIYDFKYQDKKEFNEFL